MLAEGSKDDMCSPKVNIGVLSKNNITPTLIAMPTLCISIFVERLSQRLLLLSLPKACAEAPVVDIRKKPHTQIICVKINAAMLAPASNDAESIRPNTAVSTKPTKGVVMFASIIGIAKANICRCDLQPPNRPIFIIDIVLTCRTHMKIPSSIFISLRKIIKRNMNVLVSFLLISTSVNAVENNDILNQSAVILVYHHVSSTTPASTSLSAKQFEQHLDFIAQSFNVVPLEDIVHKLKSGKPFKPNSIAITFDDGYDNILSNAHPLLTDRNMPYTVFVNPARIGKEKGQLTWQELADMQQQGVTIANHTMDHLHMLTTLANETQSQWLERVWTNVQTAQQQLEENLDNVPKWLAYPFGEYNQALAEKLLEENFIGFAQHSGGVSSHSSFAALTRFPAAGIYANMNSLKTKIASFAMPVITSKPSDPERALGSTLTFSFSVETDDLVLSQIQCFYGGKSVDTEIKEDSVFVNNGIVLPVGRSRVNCTAPSLSQKGRYYWYSQPFFVANEKGVYPD